MARKKIGTRVSATKRTKPNPGVMKAIELAGTQRKLAALMQVEQPAVYHWLYKSCPPERALELEDKFGVPKEMTCPEIFVR
jgi:DNA-binding transcriptional regulator YdaS (Cro superfamily)